MKTKTYILTFFIFFSGVVFGQKVWDKNYSEDEFIEFRKKVYSLESLRLEIEIVPTDTISLTNKNGMIDTYKLKYYNRTGNAPSFGTFIMSSVTNPVSYSCLKYGTDYIVIELARTTSTPHSATYYYEIIRKDE